MVKVMITIGGAAALFVSSSGTVPEKVS